ncbi:MAG: T9SS type A sorting domain-containing protein [Taibaiella sp.]|nr:T9SS type A sorting domain-containing protein [Taibaiella sp.]
MSSKSAPVFIENRGQVQDQNGRLRKDVAYYVTSDRASIYLTPNGIHYQFPDKKNNQFIEHRLDVVLIDADDRCVITAEAPQLYHENYIQQDGCSVTAASFSRIIYKDVYPNIDWVIYIKGQQLEYDFIIRPGGNIKNIRLEYKGAKRMNLQSGNLIVRGDFGIIKENAPVMYSIERHTPVKGAFTLNNGILSYYAGKHSGTLVIDPKISWATYFGGSSEEHIGNIRCDAAGNLYMCGTTGSSSFIATTGAYKTVLSSPFLGHTGGSYSFSGNAFIAKFDANGNRLWATYYGGATYEWAKDIALGSNGEVYVTGTTASDTGIATAGAAISTPTNGFLARFDTAGHLKWGTYTIGSGNSTCVASPGKLTLCTYLATGAYITYKTSILVQQFDSSGTLKWKDTISGNNDAYGTQILYDNSANFYVVGVTTSDSGIVDTGRYRMSGQVGFVIKMDSSGKKKWGRCYGTSNTTIAGIAIYKDSMYVTGQTAEAVFGTIGTFQPTPASSIFLAKMDTSGKISWSSYLGDTINRLLSPAASQGTSIACDTSGYIYSCGITSYSSNITTSTGYKPTFQRVNYFEFLNTYLVKFTPNGQKLWGTYLARNLYIQDAASSSEIPEEMGNVVCDGSNNAYVAGATVDSSGDATTGAYQTLNRGLTDIYVYKFSDDTSLVINQPYADTAFCRGASFTLPYSCDKVFASGNVFKAQLSDSLGHFDSAVIIGMLTARQSGSISCSIPTTVRNGRHYRIRVVATAPAFVGTGDGYDIAIIDSIADAAAKVNSPVCDKDTMRFSANATTGATYTWTGTVTVSGGSKLSVTPVTKAMSGTYHLAISASGCPSKYDSVVVSVHNTPSMTKLTINSNCTTDTLRFLATDTTSGVTYLWTGPAGFYDTSGNSVTIPGEIPGMYWSRAVLGGCLSKPNGVNIAQGPPKPHLVALTSLCSGTSLIVANVTADSNTESQWMWIDKYHTISSDTLQLTGTTKQIWYVYTATSKNGCTRKDSIYYGAPLVPALIADTPVCMGDSLFASVDDPFHLFRYYWIAPDSTLIDSLYNIRIPHPKVGSYTAHVTSINNCLLAALTLNVEIDSILHPTVYITQIPERFVPGFNVVFQAHPVNAGKNVSYQWKKNGIIILGATSNGYITKYLMKHDKISVAIHANNKCAIPDTAYSETNPLDITETEEISGGLTIYPNPNTGTFTIKGKWNVANEAAARLQVFNSVGQRVFEENTVVRNNQVNKTIDTKNLPDGIYLLRVISNSQQEELKFSIQR